MVWKEHGMTWIFLNLFCLVLWHILSSVGNVPCTPEKNVYCAVLGWNVLNLSVKSIWSSVSFKVTTYLLIFWLNDLSIDVIGVLKCPTMFLTVLCIWMPPHWVHICLQLFFLLDCTFYYYNVLLCLLLRFYFSICFIWYRYCCCSFLLIPICMVNVSPSHCFLFVGIFGCIVCLL